MTKPFAPAHLIERAAERLLDQVGLAPPTAALGARGARAPQFAPIAEPHAPPAPQHVPPIMHPREEPGGMPGLDLAALAAAGLQIGGPRRSRISEEYQILSAQVARALAAPATGSPERRDPAPANLLMVTSARPAEGKTFTALNLAASLASTRHKRTLLIDGDPKPNSLSALLQLSGRAGLFDLAVDPAVEMAGLIVPTVIDSMTVLPIGSLIEDANLTLKVATVLTAIARRYSDHLVVLDAPPCLATSDPSTLSSHVGQIVMVVEAERTQRRELERALDLVASCPNIALMLNKTRTAYSNNFGAYGYYGA